MTQLHDAVDKLFSETDHLDRALGDDDDLTHERVQLALAAAKRVRRASNILVQALACHRDRYSPGGHKQP